MRYTQRKDNEDFYVPVGEIYRLACCDCGLVHDFVFVPVGEQINVACARNNRATAQRRKGRAKEGLYRLVERFTPIQNGRTAAPEKPIADYSALSTLEIEG